MMALSTSPADLARDALGRNVRGLKSQGAQRWAFSLQRDRSALGSASIVDGWLHLRLPLANGVALETLADFLGWNGQLEGGAKFCLDAQQPCLAAELPIGEELPLDERLAASVHGFEQGLRMVEVSVPSPSAASASTSEDGAAIDMQALCREAGWPCVARPSGELAVELDVPGRFHQAVLRVGPAQRLDLSVEIGDLQHVQPISRQALAVLLLSAADIFRLARPVLRTTGAKQPLVWHVALNEDATAAELGHGLAALSVACRQSAREVKLLEDPMIAREYLLVRGWSVDQKSNSTLSS
jgi:hypothetical protein